MENSTEYLPGVTTVADNWTSAAPNSSPSPAAQFVYICEAVIIPILGALGIVTNVISLLVLPHSQVVRVFKYCLVALTISDLLASATGFSQMMIEIFVYDGNVPFGFWEDIAVVNYALYYLFSCFLATSSAIVVAIVVIRHYIIWKPLHARQTLTTRKIKGIMISISVLTLFLFLPTSLLIIWQSCYSDKSNFCVSINEAIPSLREISVLYTSILVFIFGPIFLLVYVICVFCIRMTLRKSMDGTSMRASKGGRRQSDATRKEKAYLITRTLLIILILDCICTLPLAVQAVALVVVPEKVVFARASSESYKVFDVFVEIFLFLKPNYNFILYVFSHSEFREAALDLLPKWCAACISHPGACFRNCTNPQKHKVYHVNKEESAKPNGTYKMEGKNSVSKVRIKDIEY